MIKYKLLLLFCLSICFQLSGQKLDQRLEGLETEVDSLMNAYHAVGLSVAIVENGEVIYAKGFGYRDLEKEQPATANTIYRIGSVTKQFTASLIGIYESQNKLSLEDKPSRHIEYLKFYTNEMDNLITIEDLITHRSGIGTVDGAHVFFPTNDIDQHLKRLSYLKPNGDVRRQFDYCNMGYAILGAISEKITQKTWSENLKESFFDPLEMTSSNTALALSSYDDFSFGYSVRENNPVKVLAENQHESVASGAMNSSVNDMAKWMLMLLNKGKYKAVQVLPTSYLENAFSEHCVQMPSFKFDEEKDMTFNTYGLAWFINDYKGEYRVMHGGNVSGFSAMLQLFPHKKLGIVVLSNQTSSGIASNIADIIADRTLKLKRKAWKDYEVQVSEVRPINKTLQPINEANKPTCSLKNFCGDYENKGYGILNVFLKNGNLYLKLPAFTLGLEHAEGNGFVSRTITELHQNCPNFLYDFSVNEEGQVSKLSVGMQRVPVEFVKL